MIRRNALLFAVIPILFLLLLTGCRSIPLGVDEWAASTTKLHTNTVLVGEASVATAKQAAETVDPTNRHVIDVVISQLEVEWNHRKDVLEALDKYAQTLSRLVASGQNGAKEAGRAIDAIKGMVSTVHTLNPVGSLIFEQVASGLKIVWNRATYELAARSLSEALNGTEPIIERIAKILDEDMKNLRAITVLARPKLRNVLKEKYRSNLDDLKDMLDREIEPRKDILGATQTVPPNNYQRLQAIQGSIDFEQKKDWYRDYNLALSAQNESLDSQLAMLDASTQLLHEWVRVYGQLAIAAKTGQTPTTTVLLDLSVELTKVALDTRVKLRMLGRQ